MVENKQKNQTETKPTGTYSVSSATSRSPRTVSFRIPSLPRPQLKPLGRGRVGGVVLLLAFVMTAMLGGVGGAWLQNRYDNDGTAVTSLGNQKKIVSSQSQLISQIAKSVGPSVVSVNVNITNASQDSFGVFGFAPPEQQQAAGTGIIISKSGIVVTNRHVVPNGTTSVSVTLADGTELKNVSVIGRTNDNDSLDVAFLKINDAKGHSLKPAAIGDSSKVQVGDNVVAIGNALGQFQNTVTSGIISGYGRSVQAGDASGANSSTENLDNLFQTDAAINEGNSGGPLVNLNGQVIGINTAIASNSQSIGFAIPISDVKGLIGQVIKTGKFARPYMGLRYIPLTADVASEFGLNIQNGAFIAPSNDPSTSSVIAGSPAEKAGLKERDIITQINGRNVDQTHSLTSVLDQYQPGEKIRLTVVRGGDTKHLNLTLGSLPVSN
jgi:serine protease Do